MVLEKDLEQPVVAARVDAAALLVVLEVERVTPPVGPAGHAVVLVVAEAERVPVEVLDLDQVAGLVVLEGHQVMLPAPHLRVGQEQAQEPPFPVALDADLPSLRVDEFLEAT